MPFELIQKSDYFHLEEVAVGIYAAIIVPGTGALGNAGIVDLGDRTLVFDTFFTPQAASDLKTAAEQLFHRPVTLVANSHYHNDHVHGNQVFPDADIVSTTQTRDAILARNPRLIEIAKAHPEYPKQLEEELNNETDESKRMEMQIQLGDIKAYSNALPTLQLRIPNLTFEREFIFHGSKRTAKLMTYGGGHTQSDAFLYLPDDQIVFMGDLISVLNHNQFRDGDAEEWVRILEKVEQLPILTAIPGHGPVGSLEDVRTMRTYLAEMIQLAANLRQVGFPADQASELQIPDPYAHWAVPSIYKKNIQQLLKTNS